MSYRRPPALPDRPEDAPGVVPQVSPATSASTVSSVPADAEEGPPGTSSSLPIAPPSALEIFGDQLPLATALVGLLASEGVLRGALGPREVERLWQRHVLNSAVVGELLPAGARVVDVGSGAGLPGLPLAIRRPDLQLELVEPMLRRTEFLLFLIERLGLPNVRVVRGRAEDTEVRAAVGGAQWVVARAVAPLARLVEWCVPLLAPGGHLLALKGARARDEFAAAAPILSRLGATAPVLREVGAGLAVEQTWVVEVRRSAGPRTRQEGRRRG